MRTLSMLALGAVLLISIQASTALGQGAIRYKFKPGQKLLYITTQNTVNKAKGASQPTEFSTVLKQTTEMVWHVKEVDKDGNATIDQSIRRMKLDISLPGNIKIVYDTDSDEELVGPAAAAVKPALDALSKATFVVTMNARGEITKLDVPKDLVEAMKPLSAQMGELSTKEGFEKMIMQGSLKFPEGDLKVGQKWATQFDMKNAQLGKQTIQTKYEFRGPSKEDDSLADFGISISLNMSGVPGRTSVKINKQESKGTILFDPAAGHMRSAKVNMKMNMDLSIGGRSVKSDLDQTINVVVKPLDD